MTAKRVKKPWYGYHDLLIEANARTAYHQGGGEKSCPYIYDLRAKKIWLAAFRKEKRRDKKQAGA